MRQAFKTAGVLLAIIGLSGLTELPALANHTCAHKIELRRAYKASGTRRATQTREWKARRARQISDWNRRRASQLRRVRLTKNRGQAISYKRRTRNIRSWNRRRTTQLRARNQRRTIQLKERNQRYINQVR